MWASCVKLNLVGAPVNPSGSCGQGMWRGWVVPPEAGQEPVEVGAGELPVEWPGGGVVVLLEGEDLGGEGF